MSPRSPASDPPSCDHAVQGPPSAFDWYAGEARRALVSRVRRRLGREVRRAVDPEDVVQESLVTALRATRGQWSDSRAALVVFVQRIAELRIRHEGRRAGVRRAASLGDEGDVPDGGEEPCGSGLGEPGEGLGAGGLLGAGSGLREEHRWSLFLREWMGCSWETQAFLLDRPSTWAARSLQRRARVALAEKRRAR